MRLAACPVRATIDVIEGKVEADYRECFETRHAAVSGSCGATFRKPAGRCSRTNCANWRPTKLFLREASEQPWERVAYALSPYGQTLVPVLTVMAHWGEAT